MRLVSLQLSRYGNFAGDRIDFDPRPGCLNLLYAPNGAGKSVLRQAFCDLLYGIAGQTPMGFRFGYAGMRISAEAVAPDGTRVGFGRRKGQGNTLVDASGMPDESGALARLLGQSDRALLERLFALDTEALRRGGEALLASGGAVADALLAGGGMRGVKELRQGLEAASDALAPSRRSAQRPFYLALDSLLEARKRAANALLRPDDWHRLERELTDAEAAQAEQNRAVAAEATRMAQLQRVRRVRVPMVERDAAEAWLLGHLHVPILPASLEPRLAEAIGAAAAAAQLLEREAGRRAELAGELAAITVDATLLHAATEIERLAEQAGAVAKALVDIPKRDAEHAASLARIAGLLRRLGSDVPLEQAGSVLPDRATESRARGLIAQHGAVIAAAEQAAAAITAAARDIADKTTELAGLPLPEGNDAVAPLVAEIRAAGDPILRADEAARAVDDSLAALTAAGAAVPAWRGSTGDLVALTLLPVASYERLDAARAGAAAERARLADRARDAASRHDDAMARLEKLIGGGAVPDEAGVVAARRHRDRGWQLIYRRAFTSDPPSPSEQESFAGDEPLPLAYAHAVDQADILADRRVGEADLIARAAASRRAVAEAESARGAAEASLAPAETVAASAERAWSEACAGLPLGVAPGLDEVRSFLAARDRVVVLSQAVERDQRAASRITARHDAWAARLAEVLALPALPLPALLARAEDNLAAASRTTKLRIAVEAGLREMRRRLEAGEAALAEATRKRAAWQADWDAALRQLGRPPAEHPSVTADILELLDELNQEHRAVTVTGDRLRRMQTDNDAFAATVALLLAKAAPDLAHGDATSADRLAALRALRERLQDHRARAARRAELQKLLDQADRQLVQLTAALAQRRVDHEAALATIGAATDAAAEQILAESRERAGHAATMAQAEARLREDGDGLTVEHLRQELAAFPPDEVPAALIAAEAATSAANSGAQEAAALASRQRLQMDQRADERAHATAIGEQESAVATLDRVLEEALLARLAASLLGRAMAAVEEQGGTALLTRISHYLRLLSEGAYDRVVTEDDGLGGLALAVIPHDLPHEQKRVEELSEGTRDQLYLALRLAAIEDHVAAAPPLPFIGDDILQTSDDGRATAALHALLELSRHVQIILLTHHPHVLQLAAALPEGTVHVCRITSGAA